MRLVWTVTLTSMLMFAAPLIGGFTPLRAPASPETIVLKSTPDGTWNGLRNGSYALSDSPRTQWPAS